LMPLPCYCCYFLLDAVATKRHDAIRAIYIITLRLLLFLLVADAAMLLMPLRRHAGHAPCCR